jgi:7-cyano-7-deazaguanine synthase in queuosine biosynthesis
MTPDGTSKPSRSILVRSLERYLQAKKPLRRETGCELAAHSEDFSGYPDCRPAFFDAFQNVIGVGTNRRLKLS